MAPSVCLWTNANFNIMATISIYRLKKKNPSPIWPRINFFVRIKKCYREQHLLFYSFSTWRRKSVRQTDFSESTLTMDRRQFPFFTNAKMYIPLYSFRAFKKTRNLPTPAMRQLTARCECGNRNAVRERTTEAFLYKKERKKRRVAQLHAYTRDQLPLSSMANFFFSFFPCAHIENNTNHSWSIMISRHFVYNNSISITIAFVYSPLSLPQPK